MKRSSLFVGIAGPSCSGKSTLESNLSQEFGDDLALVAFDDFFVGLKVLEGQDITNWESPDLYRWPLYLDMIRQLSKGETVQYEPHSHEAKQAGITERIIEPRPIVLVTGFLALYSTEVNRLLDLKIYIDIPESETVRRRLERSRGRPVGPWNSRGYINGVLLPATGEFVVPQKSFADTVIDGLKSPGFIASQTVDAIKERRSISL